MKPFLAATLAGLLVAGCATDEAATSHSSASKAALETASSPVATSSAPEATRFLGGPPLCTKDPHWKFVLNNARRTADAYATERNPSAVFIGPGTTEDFILQRGGEHEGRYLLKLVTNDGRNTSFAMLKPLFDEYASSEGLDDSGRLWEVVVAKYNGRMF